MPHRDPYAPAASHELLFRQVNSYSREMDATVHGAFVCIDKKNFNLLEHLRRRIKTARALWVEGDNTCLSLQKAIRGGVRQVSGTTLVIGTPYEQIKLLLTLDDPEFVTDLLHPMIEQSGPRVSYPFLTSQAIVKLLRSASRDDSVHSFEMKHLAVRSKIHGRPEGRKVRAERIWTEESLDAALATVSDRGQWMHSAEFEYQLKGSRKPKKHVGHVSRRSTFRTRGEFEWFQRHMVEPLVEEVAAALKFYSQRSRMESPDRTPRPIVIEYSENVFQDKAQNRRLVQALGRMQRASVSVLHANPYLKASIVDFMDGSSYEVWVLSSNRIIVSPQFRATFASVERVCDHIMSRFAEGELKDYSETHG